MSEVIFKIFTFLIIIILGFIAKKANFLKKEDGYVLGRLILTITLPCALIVNASAMEFNEFSIFLILLGITCNLLTVFISSIITKDKSNISRAVYMINSSGYNIGNFAMPFITVFFPSVIVGYACMFDVGNAIMGLGGVYCIASKYIDGSSKITINSFIKKMFNSIPLVVYFSLIFISIFKLEIPNSIFSIASTIGASNSVLVMLMIGILLEFNISKKDLKDTVTIILIRLCVSVLMTLILCLLPIDVMIKKVIIICLFSPVSSAAVIYSRQCDYKGDMPAMVNSISIILSIIICMPLLVLFSM